MNPLVSCRVGALALLAVVSWPWTAALPAQQMSDTSFLAGFHQPVAFAFHGTDRVYLAERRGVVRVVQNGTAVPAPLVDLSDEVGMWRDYGLIGLALDPNFGSNGYYYLAYVVDRHHLLHYGTPAYNAGFDQYYAATIMRVTRYTADAASGFTTTVPGSRLVLFGETPATGAPLLHESHGACQILFGSDGTLLVAVGDGAHFHLGGDFGNDPATYSQQALADGILRPDEDVGVFRSQQLSSHCGKILRLDPATGDGVPSNPFFDATSPRSARSRTYALGLRNPFRMALRPGTGAANPALGQPGVLYLGDVGWYTREELNVCTEPGQNFGWPIFEGITPNPLYEFAFVANPDAPNPLSGQSGCSVPFFRFQDLLRQAAPGHAAPFVNPCDASVPIPSSIPTFVHAMPVLDWHHSWFDVRVPKFENGVLVTRLLGSPESGIPGPQWNGGASVAGCWHSGLTFPASFGPCYYHADYGIGWLRRFEFDDHDHLLAVHDLHSTVYPVMMHEHPVDHSLLYLSLTDLQIRAIRFGVEPPPTAVPKADVRYGLGAFDVQLDARDSFDPQGQELTYLWDLGNGRTSTAAQLGHRFRSTASPALHPVQLTVTDTMGQSHAATLPIAVDNTPPSVEIISIADGALYSLTAPTVLPLAANATDREHGPQQLTWSWQVTMHHGTHIHPEPPSNQSTTMATLVPTPAGDEFFAYSVRLTVTDAGGLATTVTRWLFPDTAGASTAVVMTAPAAGDRVEDSSGVRFGAVTTGSPARVEYYVDGLLVGTATSTPYVSTWAPSSPGLHTASALAIGTDGTSSSSRGVEFVVEAPMVTKVRIHSGGDDAVEAADQPSVPQASSGALVLGDDGRPWTTGLRFALPQLPPGARVHAASIDFTAAQADAGPATFEIRCDASSNAAPIRTRTKDLLGRVTSPAVPWTPGDWQPLASTGPQRTPDLAPLLEPLVTHPKWRQHVVVLLSGTGLRHAIAWDGNRTTAPLLSVTWSPPLPQMLQIAAVDDGSEDLGLGAVHLHDQLLPLGELPGGPRLSAVRFALPLAAGTRIAAARVRFTSAGSDLGPAQLLLGLEAQDDAAPLTKTSGDLSSRVLLPTSVRWCPAEWPTPAANGTEQIAVDVGALVQQIVDRTGWQKGQHIAVLVWGAGSRLAATVDAGAQQAAVLELAIAP